MGVMDKLPSLATPLKAGSTQGLSEADRKTIILGAWLVSAVMLVFSNRYVLIDLKFGAPITLVAWQSFAVVLVSQVLSLQQRLSDAPLAPGNVISWSSYGTHLAPIGALLGIIPLWSTIASRTLPLWQMGVLYGLTPLITALLGRFLGARISLSKFTQIAGIMVALMIATVGGIRFGKYDTHLTDRQLYGAGWTKHQATQNSTYPKTASLSSAEILGLPADTSAVPSVDPAEVVNVLIALLCGLFAVSAEAASKVLMEVMLKAREDRMSPTRLVANIAPVSFAIVAISAHFMESADAGAALFALPSGVLLSNGIAGVIVAYAIPVVIQMTSSTTYVLADSFRQTFVAFLACVIYNIPIGILHACSYFIGFIGFAKYAEKEIPRDAKMKPSDYSRVTRVSGDSDSAHDREANHSPSPEVEDEKASDVTGAGVNMFIVLCGILLAVLVAASMTARPVLSSAQALRYEQTIVPYENSKIATIIEPRNLAHLGPLLLQFLTVLPPDWPILAWCSPENIEVLRQIPALARNIDEGRLELRLFPHQFDIHDQEYLSRFLTKPWFWETLGKEWILFFQSDSVLCSKSPQKIDDWLGFDWVGAPWEDSPNAHGGNGGLSLRKRSSMIKLTSNPDIAREDYGDPEDVWFSKNLATLPDVRWPTEHQAKFSVENIFGAMAEWSWRPLGVHSGGEPPATWRSEDIMGRLMDWCPELKLFYDPRKYIGT